MSQLNRIVIFCHPSFMKSQSMPRFANMLKEAYEARGYHVTLWAPQAFFFNLIQCQKLNKWAGYIDQYIIFPFWVRKALKQQSKETLYVFADQALGPWVPLVTHLPHVVHVHDLLALKSALNMVPENPTSLTGKIYQRYIRNGFKKAKHFISISHKTQSDLHTVGQITPIHSTVVYNGLNYAYAPLSEESALEVLVEAGLPASPQKMLLHLGGSQWYKNLPGVISIYAEYVKLLAERGVDQPPPLWCISPPPSAVVKKLIETLPKNAKVLFFQGLDNQTLQAAYSYAEAFLFPSLAEGFGWPLVEAQACGCPVLTTDDAPMNEVAGPVAIYVPLIEKNQNLTDWAKNAADKLDLFLQIPENDQLKIKHQAIEWSQNFNTVKAIDAYLAFYNTVIADNQTLN